MENYDYWQEEELIEKTFDKSYDIIEEIKGFIVSDNPEIENKLELLCNTIEQIKDVCLALNDRFDDVNSEYENAKYELEQGEGNFVIGNYNELKRKMEIAGFWQDEMEFFFENLIRYSNKV